MNEVKSLCDGCCLRYELFGCPYLGQGMFPSKPSIAEVEKAWGLKLAVVECAALQRVKDSQKAREEAGK